MRRNLVWLSMVCGLAAALAADDDLLLLQPQTEDIVLAPVARPAPQPAPVGPTNLVLAAGTEAEVVEGALGTGCVRIRIASGAQIWVAAAGVSGSGRLRTPGAAEDSTAKVAAFRTEADYRKAQDAEGSASSAFVGIMSDEQVMLPQKTRIAVVPNGTKVPGAALVQVLDDGPRKHARLLVALENIALEGKVKIGTAGGKAVTGYATAVAAAGGGEDGRR